MHPFYLCLFLSILIHLLYISFYSSTFYVTLFYPSTFSLSMHPFPLCFSIHIYPHTLSLFLFIQFLRISFLSSPLSLTLCRFIITDATFLFLQFEHFICLHGLHTSMQHIWGQFHTYSTFLSRFNRFQETKKSFFFSVRTYLGNDYVKARLPDCLLA
jgi:hypothetical protein